MSDSIFKLIKLPDLVTLLNALLGFTAILMVVQSPSNAYHASILLVLAVMADGLDGAIARRLEYGVLGEQLDSLADVISFGTAPAVIAYTILSPQYHYYICIIGGAFLACGILRLARFNAANIKSGFTGLPITTSGLFIVLYILVFYEWEQAYFSYGLLVSMLFLAALMVSRVPYPKIKNISMVGVTSVLLILTVALFYLDYQTGVRLAAGANIVLIGFYMLSPVTKIGYNEA